MCCPLGKLAFPCCYAEKLEVLERIRPCEWIGWTVSMWKHRTPTQDLDSFFSLLFGAHEDDKLKWFFCVELFCVEYITWN